MSSVKYFIGCNNALDGHMHIKLLVLSMVIILLLPQTPLFLFTSVTTFGGNYKVFAQSENDENNNDADTNMNTMKEDNIISPLTEWVGVFALGITVGILSPIRYKPVYSKSRSINITNLSIAILSISAGIIHLLLIPEHMKESFMWGIFFLITGIAQLIFGIIIIIIGRKVSPINKSILYYFGIIGNALLVGIFVLVRLITPPFSSEAAPVNELEPNGIITIITEILLVVLLAYLIKSTSKSQRSQKVIQ
jgi:MFS family permease